MEDEEREQCRFDRLLDEISEAVQSTKYARTLYLTATGSYQDYLESARTSRERRQDANLRKRQLQEINGAMRRGQTLAQVTEEISDSCTNNAMVIRRWREYLEEKRKQSLLRNELAALAGLPEKYRGNYRLDIARNVTHFYFGGTNGSSGDDGHGHYVIENRTGQPIYKREPFEDHGFHNVVKVVSGL